MKKNVTDTKGKHLCAQNGYLIGIIQQLCRITNAKKIYFSSKLFMKFTRIYVLNK